jgi:methylated-DNA-[protein]-cysteine S-methyltransferase
MTDIERVLAEAGRRTDAGDLEEAKRRLAAAAESEGLLDVAYARVDSPVGPIIASATPKGLLRLVYGWDRLDEVLDSLSARVSPRVVESPARLDEVRRELDEYFEGRRTEFDLPLDWRLTRGFGRRVLRATSRVPFGELATYRDVATKAGSPRAVRAAGNALGANPLPIVVPCHRVVRTGGALGGYTGGLERKEHLLRLEGSLAE